MSKHKALPNIITAPPNAQWHITIRLEKGENKFLMQVEGSEHQVYGNKKNLGKRGGPLFLVGTDEKHTIHKFLNYATNFFYTLTS